MSKNDYKQIFKSRFRTLWAYGFDSAARRAPKKLRLVRKEVLAGNLFGLQVLKIARFVR